MILKKKPRGTSLNLALKRFELAMHAQFSKQVPERDILWKKNSLKGI